MSTTTAGQLDGLADRAGTADDARAASASRSPSSAARS